ncbi:MAG: ComF family protein, partial [Proteobacteria bacterium]|nr:ComF family protein [Pseudomonadota bacterium]
LDPGARRRNVEGAFALAPAWQGRLEGAWVLLVDDVFTTGATVNECAKVLKQAGAERVEVLTLVRAVGGKS